MSEFWKIVMVILLSSVKFVAGPAFAYYDQKFDFTFLEAVVYPVMGGMLGVFVFSYFTDQIVLAIHWLKNKLKAAVTGKKDVFSEPTVDVQGNVKVNYSYIEKNAPPKPKVFTKRNRRLVTIWRKYGLMGIAFITPVIISIPVGTIVACRLVHDKKKIFLYMFVSIMFWSVAMVSAFELYHAYSIKALQHKVLDP